MASNPSDFGAQFERSFHDSYQDTQGVTGNRMQVIALLKTNAVFMIEYFLGHELDFPVPQLHIDVFNRLINVALERILLAIPRGHAKTTLAKLAVVWYFLFTTHRFCVYVSNSNTKAKDACRDIIGFLQCPNFVKLFGQINMLKSSETESIWIFEITLWDGRVKKCILRALGTGQDVRGINVDNQRPDIAVCDDVESNDDVGTEEMQKKLDKWVLGPFIKALARNHKLIWIGNMLAKTSVLARFSKMPRWNPVVYGALVKNVETGALEPLWPDLWSIEKIVADYVEYRDLGFLETWMCEMMNMPGHGQNGFRLDQIYMQPKPIPGDQQCAFLTLDPAFGEKEVNDNSSICCHIIRQDGLPMVAEHITGKMTETELFHAMVYLANKWGAYVWGIESVAAQRVLISFFNVLFALSDMTGHVEMIPLMAGKNDPKVSRIRSFVSLMAEKEYAIADDMIEFVTQAMDYSMTKKSNNDDLLDSCAYGPQMINDYLGIIMAAATGRLGLKPKIRTGMEVCDV